MNARTVGMLRLLLLLAAFQTPAALARQWRCADGTLCAACAREPDRSPQPAAPEPDECATTTVTNGNCHDCCRFVPPNAPLFAERGSVRSAAPLDSALAVPARPAEIRPLFAPRAIAAGPGAPRPTPCFSSPRSCPPRAPPLVVA